MTEDINVQISFHIAVMIPSRDIPVGVCARLRILATTDLHMNLTGYDYYADRVDASVGLVRTAGLIHTARDEAEQSGALTMLFDNGDSLQGTPLGDLTVEDMDQAHPLMQAFTHLRFDAIGLGNHDFNFGLEPLLTVLETAPCPVVCSNLRRPDGQPLSGISNFGILERTVTADGNEHPIRIGILSFLPPQTVRWDADLLLGRIEVDDIVGSARHGIGQLQRAGCDLIVALAHSGLDDKPEHEGMENAVLPLAALDGIDAVIAGHTHLHLPGASHSGLKHVNAQTGEVHGKPVVMPGTAGSHLGVIDLRIQANANRRWEVSGFDCALRPISVRGADGALVSATCEDPNLSDLLAPGHTATRALMHQPVGHTDHPLHSFFSFVAPDRSLAVVAAAQAATLRPVLVGTAAAGLPVLSAASPSKFGARSGPLSYTEVPAGEISLRHVADLHVFPNELRAVIATGHQVREWLEMSASLFHRINPGSTGSPLINPLVPGHDFDVLYGLTWQIDLMAAPRYDLAGVVRDTASQRICDIRLNGVPITPDQRFVVALNNYRAGGGGNFAALRNTEMLPVPPMTIREIICSYLSCAPSPDPLDTALPAWSFKPMPDTRVSVQTGPGAIAYLDELADRNVTVSGPGADGFLSLTLGL